MLYHATNPILRIVGVEHMKWDAGTFKVNPREYSALAFRISGSAVIDNAGNERRIIKAQSILNAGGSAKTAAYIAGFKDFSVFYRCFLKKVGITTTEYIKTDKFLNHVNQ